MSLLAVIKPIRLPVYKNGLDRICQRRQALRHPRATERSARSLYPAEDIIYICPGHSSTRKVTLTTTRTMTRRSLAGTVYDRLQVFSKINFGGVAVADIYDWGRGRIFCAGIPKYRHDRQRKHHTDFLHYNRLCLDSKCTAAASKVGESSDNTMEIRLLKKLKFKRPDYFFFASGADFDHV